MSPVDRAEVVVVGGGFAGAATAWSLVRRGVTDVVLLEREDLPGRHSSGRNAAMARQSVIGDALVPLAVESVRFLAAPPPEFAPTPLFRPSGSLLLGTPDREEEFAAAIADLTERGLSPRLVDEAGITARVPFAAGAAPAIGVACPEDGIVDIAALLDGYLRGATAGGARVVTGREVTGVRVEAGAVRGVETNAGPIRTDVLVDAAGAWAGALGRLAGASPVPLSPCRRHLVQTARADFVDPTWPFVWDLDADLYFRPEPPGLLLSPCDQVELPPGPIATDPDEVARLDARLEARFPRLAEALADVGVLTSWVGFRTLAPDGAFVIGRDPALDGFVWCAGLGGHGVTTSAAVGRLTAAAVIDGTAVDALAPTRFLESESP